MLIFLYINVNGKWRGEDNVREKKKNFKKMST